MLQPGKRHQNLCSSWFHSEDFAAQKTSVGALAHLSLARACALQGDNAKSRAVYQDFLTLWKDADPDVPILTQAKAEYAKLQ